MHFKRKRLRSVEVLVHEGNSRTKAVEALKETLQYFSTHFGGANLEGLTTTEGLNDELVDVIINQLTEQVEGGIDATEKETSDEIAFNMYLSFSTENLAKNNYLYGQYQYDSELDIYRVIVWEDKAFVKSRVPEAMIVLKSPAAAD